MQQSVIFQWRIKVVIGSIPVVFAAFLLSTSTGFGAERIVQSAALSTGFYDPKVQGQEEPFPGYAETCGYRIFLKPTRHVALADSADDGTKVIYIDPLLTAPGNEFHKAFLIAHECAHHRLGHTTEAGLDRRFTSRRAVTDQELSADCWAAELLSRAGLSSFTTSMSRQIQRSGRFSGVGGYPGGMQRAAIIRQCAQAGQDQVPARKLAASVIK